MWNKTEKTLKFSVSELFQGFSHVEKYSGSQMWNKTEIKHCRRCSSEITVVLFQFYFIRYASRSNLYFPKQNPYIIPHAILTL